MIMTLGFPTTVRLTEAMTVPLKSVQRGISSAAFSAKQMKKAQEKLRRSQPLLRQYDCKLVEVPEKMKVVLLGVNHRKINSVEAVQRITQRMDPDAVCVELCDSRAQPLAEEVQRLSNPRAFLSKDVGSLLRRISSDDFSPENGMELRLAMLEARRMLKPCFLVDRSISVTRRRLKARLRIGMYLHQWFPLTSKIAVAWKLRGAFTTGIVPASVVRVLFALGRWQLPWLARQELLSQTEWVGGEEVVPGDAILKALEVGSLAEEQYGDFPDAQSKSLLGDVFLPHRIEDLGPASLMDVLDRVIRAERDVFLAHRIRRIHTVTGVEYARHGLNGPLVLAVLGAAHLPGVARSLTAPMQELESHVADLEHAPLEPWRTLLPNILLARPSTA
ncbi:unnamed protein product [Effrenium voratum]|uniref:TraB family protein n=1 Tax=Effrenium voratum TaxID=2562239 RepID=A0AA36ID75_9DINO|nr:unnamed protein product [Effrenium voratum]CAJ1453658.1 unnamed protein product [Effrenium voratum]